MLRLRDVMTTDVVSLNPEMTLRYAMELLAKRHVSGAPVMVGGEVVGVVSSGDLMELAADASDVPTEQDGREEAGDSDGPPVWSDGVYAPSAYFTDVWADAGADTTTRVDFPDGPEWNALEAHTVAEAMTASPVCTLPPSAPLAEAADYMRRARVHRILVTDGAKLLGLVTTMDVTRAVADHRLETRTYAFNRSQDFDDRGQAEADDAGDGDEQC